MYYANRAKVSRKWLRPNGHYNSHWGVSTIFTKFDVDSWQSGRYRFIFVACWWSAYGVVLALRTPISETSIRRPDR